MNAGLYGKICVMPAPHSAPVPTLAEAAQWAPEQIVELAQTNAATVRQLDALQLEFQAVKHQLEWFRRQLFGQQDTTSYLEALKARAKVVRHENRLIDKADAAR